jgi:hypothetical protein
LWKLTGHLSVSRMKSANAVSQPLSENIAVSEHLSDMTTTRQLEFLRAARPTGRILDKHISGYAVLAASKPW